MSLSTPQQVQDRLNEIDQDLASRLNELEDAALEWFRAKRDKERRWAEAFVSAEGPVDARKAAALAASCDIGREDEARYEALRAVVRALETRANIGMAILKAQGRS